jgi:hypothetical protein
LEPTDTPQAAGPAALQPELPYEAFMTLVNLADAMYQQGGYEAAAVVYSEMLAYEMKPQQRASMHSLRADAYDRLGDIEAAIADYEQAVELGEEDPDILNNLCWDYGITGQPDLALPYCERAVEGDPSPPNRDSRGLANAQLGNTDAAITDFRAVVDDLEGATDPELQAIRADRQAWIAALEAGDNPITADVLAKLREEWRAPPTAPVRCAPREGAITRSALVEVASAEGFEFGEVSAAAGQESVTGELSWDGCSSSLSLVGPETGITGGGLRVHGCDDQTQSGIAFWFMAEFLQGDAECAQAMVWTVTDLYYVIEGAKEAATPRTIGDVTFSARSISDAEPGLEITAEVTQ